MFGFTHMNPGVRTLLLAVFFASLGLWLLTPILGRDPVAYLAFSGSDFLHGRPWQAFTYPWFYPGEAMFQWIGHSLILWVFGNAVEEEVGTQRLYRMFGLSAVMGALVGSLYSLLGPPVGTSGMTVPLFAITMMYFYINREAIGWVPVKGKYLGLILGAFTWANHPSLIPSFIAATGGGYLILVNRRWPAFSHDRSSSGPRLLAESGPKVVPFHGRIVQVVSELEVEVDRILEKLRKEGMASLTSQERETLDTHSRSLQARTGGQ